MQSNDALTRQFDYLHRPDYDEVADTALQEINRRFRQHGVGYQYTDGVIVRVDSELLHEEVIRPALSLLRDKRFEGAQSEFLAAHEHYRHGRKAEALVECVKAFESTMKTICELRGWTYDKTGTSR